MDAEAHAGLRSWLVEQGTVCQRGCADVIVPVYGCNWAQGLLDRMRALAHVGHTDASDGNMMLGCLNAGIRPSWMGKKRDTPGCEENSVCSREKRL